MHPSSMGGWQGFPVIIRLQRTLWVVIVSFFNNGFLLGSAQLRFLLGRGQVWLIGLISENSGLASAILIMTLDGFPHCQFTVLLNLNSARYAAWKSIIRIAGLA